MSSSVYTALTTCRRRGISPINVSNCCELFLNQSLVITPKHRTLTVLLGSSIRINFCRIIIPIHFTFCIMFGFLKSNDSRIINSSFHHDFICKFTANTVLDRIYRGIINGKCCFYICIKPFNLICYSFHICLGF